MWRLKKRQGGHAMKWSLTEILGAGFAVAALVAGLAAPSANAASDRPLFVAVGASARAPIGWHEFCSEYAPECETKPLAPRDIVLTTKAWKDLAWINRWVNDTVKPLTDLAPW